MRCSNFWPLWLLHCTTADADAAMRKRPAATAREADGGDRVRGENAIDDENAQRKIGLFVRKKRGGSSSSSSSSKHQQQAEEEEEDGSGSTAKIWDPQNCFLERCLKKTIPQFQFHC